jgi:hypothetical protein
MLGMVPPTNPQDHGINFDCVNMFGTVAESSGNIVARARAKDEDALRAWHDPVR